MTEPYTLAIDAMGGDRAPGVVIDGLAIAAERHPAARFLLVGDETALERVAGAQQARSGGLHDPTCPGGYTRRDEAHCSAARPRLIDAAGDRRGCDRRGAWHRLGRQHRGALLALAKIIIKTLPGIDRPAMAGIVPSARGDVIMLDLGANVQCDARNLVEFAIMGDVFARTVLGLTSPTIGLMNVGSEELKGDERVRQAADLLRMSHIGPNFHGFVEGHDLTAGTVDVVVTDGFTGNVALKTGEGALKLSGDLLKQIFRGSLAGKLAYLLARPGPGPDAAVAGPAAV